MGQDIERATSAVDFDLALSPDGVLLHTEWDSGYSQDRTGVQRAAQPELNTVTGGLGVHWPTLCLFEGTQEQRTEPAIPLIYSEASGTSPQINALQARVFERQFATSDAERALLRREIDRLRPADYRVGTATDALTLERFSDGTMSSFMRQRLNQLAENFTNADQTRGFSDRWNGQAALRTFRRNMEQFETRINATLGAEAGSREIARTYAQIGRLLRAEDAGSPFSREQRFFLARQLMRNAAHPGAINQSIDTCNAAALEVRTNILSPSDAARVVADISLTGRYRTARGLEVVIPRDVLLPDNHAAQYRAGNHRDHASQIFQLAAINAYYRTQSGNVHFIQNRDGQGSLVRRDGDRQTRIDTSPGIVLGSQIESMNEQITGRLEPIVLSATGDTLVTAQSARELATVLSGSRYMLPLDRANPGALVEGRYRVPMLALVDTRLPPFSEYSRGGGWHVVTITRYVPDARNPGQGRVAIDNTWGAGYDHTGEPGQRPLVTLDTLFEAMNSRRTQ